ncbi:MAG: hypothetical protein IPL71_09420 [Anaerolineales bacterium]|uniref:Imm63 family immunity protein n=1 Tax=Candidatus Villigracilis proximus TaxID=3140683 RepID=UPI0031364032|nr:hypothetical protein [Anaerolineales bacterium]
MSLSSIEKIQVEYNEYCRRINPAILNALIQTTRGNDGTSHLEIEDDTYHYIATERGLDLSKNSTRDKDELLYWLVSELAWGLASTYEFKTESKDRAFGACYFPKPLKISTRQTRRGRKENKKSSMQF